MAPEILKREKHQGSVVDLFAMGVTLFFLRTKIGPFADMAKHDDMFYKLVTTHKLDLFWKSHEKGFSDGYFNDEFKDLISQML